MSNYTITTDFGAKDSLPSSNSAKVVRGSEFTTEFTNIQTAIATKADTAGDTFTGAVTFDAAVTLNADVTFDTNTLFVDVSANRVGIGNVAPATALDVTGVITTDGLTSSAGIDVTGDVSLGDNDKALFGASDDLQIYHNGSDSYIDDAGVGDLVLRGNNQVFIRDRGTDEVMVNCRSGDAVKLYFDNAEKLETTSTGIDVTGTVTASSLAVDTDTLFVDATNDRVGIGTTSPNYELTVGGGTINSMQILSSTTGSGSSDGLRIWNTGVSTALWNYDNTPILFGTNDTERMRIDSSGNVGIGNTNPNSKLVVQQANGCVSKIVATDGGSQPSATAQLVMQGFEGRGAGIFIQDSKLSASNPSDRTWFMGTGYSTANFGIGFAVDGVESHYLAQNKLTIDSSGNVLVGKTSDAFEVEGMSLRGSPTSNASVATFTRDSSNVAAFNRLTDDGSLVTFYKDSTTLVGSIGTKSGEFYIAHDGTTNTGLRFRGNGTIIPVNANGNGTDASQDLGASLYRFKDIYRSGSTYSTSDRNKKQDIRDLTDAEARVATVAKGSLKAFRYIDSVEAEGDEANIHFGIIAQDLKAAFEAEGLNANDYQVFKTSTYTDDDGVEQTTYSVCYENLLAFIIAAI